MRIFCRVLFSISGYFCSILCLSCLVNINLIMLSIYIATATWIGNTNTLQLHCNYQLLIIWKMFKKTCFCLLHISLIYPLSHKSNESVIGLIRISSVSRLFENVATAAVDWLLESEISPISAYIMEWLCVRDCVHQYAIYEHGERIESMTLRTVLHCEPNWKRPVHAPTHATALFIAH